MNLIQFILNAYEYILTHERAMLQTEPMSVRFDRYTQHMTSKPGMKQLELGPTGKTVAANLHRLRTERNLTFAALTKLLEEHGHRIPELGLRRIEAEARRVDVDDLTALAIALDVSPLTLLLPPDAHPWATAEVTGLTEERGTNVIWLWGLGEEPLTVSEYPGGSDKLEILRFKAAAKPEVHARALSVPQAAWVDTGDETSTTADALRLSEAQGVRRRG